MKCKMTKDRKDAVLTDESEKIDLEHIQQL